MPLSTHFSRNFKVSPRIIVLKRSRSSDYPESTNAYRQGVKASAHEDLEHIHDELVARVQGFDLIGKELVIEGLPTRTEINKLKAAEAKLSKPFAEETIATELTKVDGTILTSAQPLGKTMAQFEQMFKKSQAKLTPLLADLDQVESEIALLLAGLGKDEATAQADAEFKNTVERLKADNDEAYQQTLDDVSKARKEDKTLSAQSKKKLEDFMKSW
jgi:hypothetical protein